MVALHKIADHQLKDLLSGGEFKLDEEEEDSVGRDDEDEDDDARFGEGGGGCHISP